VARVLFLTELLPYPLVSGAKIRAYYVLRHLATRHRVTLLSFVRPDDRPEYVEHLVGFLDRVHTVPMQRSWLRNGRALLKGLLMGRPAVVVREEIGAMRNRVRELLDTLAFDVVHADQIPMAQYGLIGRRANVRLLLDQHNATFQIVERLARCERIWWKRLLLHREARAFARYEVDVCRQFDHVAFVTEEDRQALCSRMQEEPEEAVHRFVAERTTVIPICVDTGSVRPVQPVPNPFRVTHVGTLYWPPNVEGLVWFWERVWPQVRDRIPDAKLTLIGKNPPGHIRALGQHPDVDVPGYVSDLTSYLTETAAFIVPLRAGGGMRVKIVDAWCWGLPIVSTTIGAEGIAVRPGDNILVADSPNEYANAIVGIVEDPALQSRLRLEGRRWVEKCYSWRQVYGAWDQIYDRLTDA
jgi:glycosyltransferase involved in cell wall biosynthesis